MRRFRGALAIVVTSGFCGCWLELDGLSGGPAGGVDDAGQSGGAGGSAGEGGPDARDAGPETRCSPGVACGLCESACDAAGACVAFPLADAASRSFRPWRLSAGGDALYYIDTGAGAIFRLDGTGAPARLTEAAGADAMAVNGGFLFWSSAPEGIWRCSLPDCDPKLILVPSAEAGSAYKLIGDGTHLYWITGPGAVNADVKRVHVNLQTIEPIAGGENVLSDITLDDQHVYWSVQGSPGARGKIARAHKQDLLVSVIAADLDDAPSALAVSVDTLYWTSANTNRVLACELPGCSNRRTLTPPSTNVPLLMPGSIAADERRFYFTNDGASTLMSCSISGCLEPPDFQPNVLAADQDMPRGLIASERCLFWTEGPSELSQGTARVMTVRKP